MTSDFLCSVSEARDDEDDVPSLFLQALDDSSQSGIEDDISCFLRDAENTDPECNPLQR